VASGREQPETLSLVPREFSVSLQVFPPIAMARKTALDLATSLSEHVELTDLHLGDEAWTFRRPQTSQVSPQGLISVTVEEYEIEIRHDFPTGQLEQFEHLTDLVINAVSKVIKPTHILRTGIELEYVTNFGGDAREALLGGLRLSGGEADKLAEFGRPCHLIGLRLMFPPFTVVSDEDDEADADEHAENADESNKEKIGSDWHATVTIRSLADDPGGISVEVDGHWGPITWKDGTKIVAERLNTVLEFLRERTIAFLKKFGEN